MFSLTIYCRRTLNTIPPEGVSHELTSSAQKLLRAPAPGNAEGLPLVREGDRAS